MHALGVPTSRSASLVVSEEPVIRDQFYNGNIKTEKGAVVLRLAPNWFRIGSLEILTSEREFGNLKLLVDTFISKYLSAEAVQTKHFAYNYNIPYQSINRGIDVHSPTKYLDMFAVVQNFTISMVVDWMAYGFAHGVCNTDNFSLLGITIDYGPFGFLDAYDTKFIPNTSDDEGRYAIGNQASVAMENMGRLLGALRPILTKENRKHGQKILSNFDKIYQQFLMKKFSKKLGFYKGNKMDFEFFIYPITF